MALTSKQRAQLRGLAMTEDTIIQIGKGGITENTITQVKDALKARELIKGRVLENSLLTAREAADILSKSFGKASGRTSTVAIVIAAAVAVVGAAFAIVFFSVRRRKKTVSA